MPMEHQPDPRNAPGDFYVGADECIRCGAPEHEAPDLIRMDDGGCYFFRQPVTSEEHRQATRAIWVSCCDAVRYKGNDPQILREVARLERTRSVAPNGKPWWKFW